MLNAPARGKGAQGKGREGLLPGGAVLEMGRRGAPGAASARSCYQWEPPVRSTHCSAWQWTRTVTGQALCWVGMKPSTLLCRPSSLWSLDRQEKRSGQLSNSSCVALPLPKLDQVSQLPCEALFCTDRFLLAHQNSCLNSVMLKLPRSPSS